MAEQKDDEDNPTLAFIPSDTNEEEKWSHDHCKLLYLISKYAVCAQSPEDQEGWIRELSLLVYMYEAVRRGVLDFDYAPCSMLVCPGGESRRVWLNVTQEGKSAVDDLREAKLLNGLKLSTEDFQPVTAYQVSERGLELLRVVPEDLRTEVHVSVFPPDMPYAPSKLTWPKDPKYLLRTSLEADTFFLVNDQGYRYRSSVTETEDVSYVSSPYLPTCLRATEEQPTSNAHRAHESAAGNSNISDELSEAIVLGEVNVLVGEWIPFGANQIVSLNQRLGALDRCPGGFFTNTVDDTPTDTQFKVDPGLTKVAILDYDFTRFTNFEAEINFPEDDGIVQVENFGMHLNVDGTIIYGLFVEAVLDRLADDISLDHLSRLLVDVHIDSSKIMGDLLSPYQRSQLELLFNGDVLNRGKYNMIVAQEIRPLLPAAGYMDKGDNENELKQVLGDLFSSHDLGEQDKLILGRNGALLVGPHAKDNETLVVAYLSLLTRELFIRNFFVRTFVLDAGIAKVQELILDYKRDPSYIDTIRRRSSELSRQSILLVEILAYLHESLTSMALPPRPDAAKDPVGRKLYDTLEIAQMHRDVMSRVTDLQKLGEGARKKLEIAQMQSQTITKKELEAIVKKIDVNYQDLVAASQAEARSAVSVQLMEIIFSGSFAFHLIDRIDGDDTLGAEGVDNVAGKDMSSPWLAKGAGSVTWVNTSIREHLVLPPFLWFILNMLWLFFFAYTLKRFMAYLVSLESGAASLRAILNKAIDVHKLQAFLATKQLEAQDSARSGPGNNFVKVTWKENDLELWRGDAPKCSILFDSNQGFLISVFLQWNGRRCRMSKSAVLDTFHQVLASHGIYTDLTVLPNVFEAGDRLDDPTTAVGAKKANPQG